MQGGNLRPKGRIQEVEMLKNKLRQDVSVSTTSARAAFFI